MKQNPIRKRKIPHSFYRVTIAWQPKAIAPMWPKAASAWVAVCPFCHFEISAPSRKVAKDRLHHHLKVPPSSTNSCKELPVSWVFLPKIQQFMKRQF